MVTQNEINEKEKRWKFKKIIYAFERELVELRTATYSTYSHIDPEMVVKIERCFPIVLHIRIWHLNIFFLFILVVFFVFLLFVSIFIDMEFGSCLFKFCISFITKHLCVYLYVSSSGRLTQTNHFRLLRLRFLH